MKHTTIQTLLLIIIASEYIGHTLVHEIGHSVFAFYHPKDDPDHRGLCDAANFMFYTKTTVGGESGTACSGETREMKFRQYQVQEMHNRDDEELNKIVRQ